MKIGFLFAGQGSQYVGMGKEFYDTYPTAQSMYDQVQTDFDLKEVCFNGPEEVLNDTAYTQGCILITSLVIAHTLKEKGIVPDCVAGLSLGEYSALTFADVLEIKDALDIVRQRGLIMSKALPQGVGKMAAILYGDVDTIENVCQQVTKGKEVCSIANYNSPHQIVITGTSQAVDEAGKLLLEKGVKRVIPLKVSGAFHSPLLKQASIQLKDVLDKYEFQTPNYPVVFNVTGEIETENIPYLLQEQIYNSVQFIKSVETMIENGVDTLIEIGPGRVLSGFVKKINRNVRVYSVDSVADVEKVYKELGNEQ